MINKAVDIVLSFADSSLVLNFGFRCSPVGKTNLSEPQCIEIFSIQVPKMLNDFPFTQCSFNKDSIKIIRGMETGRLSD